MNLVVRVPSYNIFKFRNPYVGIGVLGLAVLYVRIPRWVLNAADALAAELAYARSTLGAINE